MLYVPAYMEIGTINVSAIVARYDKTIVTATEKFGVPYFSITDIESSFYRPYNLIAVFPNPADLYHIAVDLLRMFRWREVAVLYQTEEGKYSGRYAKPNSSNCLLFQVSSYCCLALHGSSPVMNRHLYIMHPTTCHKRLPFMSDPLSSPNCGYSDHPS